MTGPDREWRLTSRDGLTVLECAPLGAIAGVGHMFTTRVGGVSQTPFATLNLAHHVDDDPDAVAENRRRVADMAGLDPDQLISASQVHGADVAVVDSQKSAKAAEEASADALLVTIPRLAVGVLVADCLPVVVVAPGAGVGVAHAGWRGTIAGVTNQLVEALSRVARTPPNRMRAAIGPGIGADDFEVGPDVAAAFARAFPGGVARPAIESASGEPDRWLVDLAAANRHQLLSSGLGADSIHQSHVSTAANLNYFYSHRAEAGRTGRFGAFVWLE